MNWNQLIGHFHPLVVHLPIGILLLAWLAALLGRRNSFYFLEPAVPFMVRTGAAAAIQACASGWLLAESDTYETGTLDWHRWLGIGTAALAVIAAFIPKNLPLLSLTVVVLAAAGHFGGTLTHGAGYLWPAENADNTAAVPSDIQEVGAYTYLIAPVLKEKCSQCHGAQKQKGGLRLDSPEAISAGGKHGAILAAGDAASSEMIKRLLLPPEDEHHMPPRERPQLTADETALLRWWINAGADFQKKTKEIPQTQEIQQLIGRMNAGKQPEAPAIPDVPTETVSPAKPELLEALRRRGLVVLPVAQNSNYLHVSAINIAQLPDSAWAELGQLAPQLVWLKLDGVALPAVAWENLTKLHRLTRLNLARTAASNSEIPYLKKLPALQTLNLAFTPVTAQGVVLLKGQPSLRHVYLYGSQVNTNDWPVIVQALPGVKIDSGGYQVPTLLSDTTKLKAENKY